MARWSKRNHRPKRGLSAKEYIDVVYVLYCKEFQGAYDVPVTARERAEDTFLTPEQWRRKQNAIALKQMGIGR